MRESMIDTVPVGGHRLSRHGEAESAAGAGLSSVSGGGGDQAPIGPGSYLAGGIDEQYARRRGGVSGILLRLLANIVDAPCHWQGRIR